jgi:glycerophosphoryl diester phosphodiesterase
MKNVKNLILCGCLIYFFISVGCEKMQTKNNNQLIITAHRGASGLAPENTLASVKKAMEIGAQFSEIDVHLTKDEKIVLLHDVTLERTTNDSGAVYSKTLQELKMLDAGKWFGEDFNGEPIPTLKEVLTLVSGRMKLNIEIKISGNEPNIAKKVVQLINQENFAKQCIVTSFDEATVRKVKQIDEKIVTGLIIGGEYKSDPFDGDWEIISTNYKNVDSQFMDKARQAKKFVHVWTVNETAEMERLIELKVDGIITNVPHILKELVQTL